MALQGPLGPRVTIALLSLAGMIFALLAGSADSNGAFIAYIVGALLFWVASGLTMGLKPTEEATA